MASPRIRSKRSSVEGKVPAASQLMRGEFAVNSYDGKVYILKDQSSVGIATTTVTVNPWEEPNGVGAGVSYSSDVNVLGVVTATSFVGDGSGLTNINIAGISTFSGDYNHLYNKPTIPTNNNQLTNGAGYITGYTVTESDVTSHQSALSITESQISDLGTYLTSSDLSSYATTSYVDTEVAGLVDSAPGTLNTLNELAAALGDDANFSTTVTNSIAAKLPLSGGTMTGNITFTTSQTFNYNNLTNKPTIPTNNNQLTNGAGYITSADGGNAATLDSLDSTQFLRSDANDTATGQITLSGGLSTNGEDVYTANGALIANDGNGAFASRTGNNIDHIWHNDTSNAWHFCSDTTYKNNGNSTVYAGSFSAAGNTVWHAGNDGSGSGLDADTVDGIQASSFLRSDANDSFSGTITGTSDGTNPVFTIDGVGPNIVRFLDAGSATTGIDLVFRTGPNTLGFEKSTDGTNLWQTDCDTGVTNFNYTPTVSGNNVLTTANEGSGNGIDADTVDGIHASSFLRSDADDTSTGRLNLQRGFTSDIDYHLYIRQTTNGEGATIKFADDTNATQFGYFTYKHQDVSSNSASNSFHFDSSESSTAVIIDQTSGNSGFYVGTNEVWHAGNDGSGSGLDADTLDGVQASSFLRSDAADSFSGALTGSGTISVSGTKIECGRSSGSVAMTTNDGYGNANLCFNHTSGTPDVSGSACRIETAVDSSTGTFMFEVGNSVTAGTPANLTQILKLATAEITSYRSIIPSSNNTRDLGSGSNRWRNVYTNDLNLSNKGGANDVDGTWGDWTMQEGENDMFMINNRTGNKFRIKLEPV